MTDITHANTDGTTTHREVRNVFDFVHKAGFSWIPGKNKRPLTAWKSKGEFFQPDDLVSMDYYRYDGIKELLIPTEQNNLVVIDCDVITENGVNVPVGVRNLIRMLKQKHHEELITDYLMRFSDPIAVKDNRPFFPKRIQPVPGSNAPATLADPMQDRVPGGQVGMPPDVSTQSAMTASCVRHDGTAPSDVQGVQGADNDVNRTSGRVVDGNIVNRSSLNAALWKASVITPSGGMHFYFRSRNAATYSSCAGVLAQHVDVRAKGGVIVSPMSYRALPEERDACTGSQNDSSCHDNYGNGESAQGSGKRQLFNRYYPSSAMMRGVIPELPQALAQLLPPAVKLPPVNLSYPRPSF